MASELETLQAISQHGDLNPIQAGRLKQLQGAGSTGNEFGIESTGLPSSGTPTGSPGAGTSALDTRFAQGKSDVTDFLTKYNTGTGNIISDVSSKYDLPGQAAGVNALNTRIKTLQGNMDNSGAGGYASSGQVDAAINSRYLPQYSTALTNLANSTGLAQNEEAMRLKPLETEGSMLGERLAREMTGYTSEQQRELDGYIEKLRSGTTLTQQEMINANNLSVAQQNYNAAIDAQKAKNIYQTVPAGQTLYNTVTNTPFVAK